MKKILLFALLCTYSLPTIAQKSPKWLEKAAKAVFTIEVYDKHGNVLSGNGFFISPTGEAVSDYTLFTGATKAIVTDAEGRKMPVKKILGADELYDVIRFLVDVPKNISYLSQTKIPLEVGGEAYLLFPGTTKGSVISKGNILEVTKVKEQYGYYQIDVSLASSQISIPLLTSEGEVFAIAQADVSGKDKTYGISVPYIQSIRVNAMDLFNKTYSSIDIEKAWPASVEDAQVALLLYASNQDAATYLGTLNDFIKIFPNSPEGYLSRASHYVYRRKELAQTEAEQMQLLILAQADLEASVKYNPNIADAYYNQAKLIYSAVMRDSTILSEDWTMKVAESKLRQALAKDNLPIYHQLEGDIAFFQGDFEKAYSSYMLVNQSPIATGESYYFAAKAMQQIPGGNLLEIISLLDSAVQRSASPSDAIVYLQENIDFKTQFGQYEALVKDYDFYYYLLGGNVTDAFFYYREQAKFRSGDFEGALEDITSAIAISPDHAIYLAEEGAIYLRLQELQKAQQSIEKAIALDPDFASGYRLLGVSLLRQEKKNEACKAFAKAKELGDPVVEKLIKENCL